MLMPSGYRVPGIVVVLKEAVRDSVTVAVSVSLVSVAGQIGSGAVCRPCAARGSGAGRSVGSSGSWARDAVQIVRDRVRGSSAGRSVRSRSGRGRCRPWARCRRPERGRVPVCCPERVRRPSGRVDPVRSGRCRCRPSGDCGRGRCPSGRCYPDGGVGVCMRCSSGR